MRYRICFDLDDTMEDLVGAWTKWLNDRYGRNVRREDVTEWELLDTYPGLTPAQIYEPLHHSEFWDSVEAMDGAVEVIAGLIADGYDVYVVTASHPQEFYLKMENMFGSLFGWIGYNKVICTANKQMIDCDVLVDDRPENLIGDTIYDPVLFTQPHNAKFDAYKHHIYRVGNWNEIDSFIRVHYPIKGSKT